MLPQSGPCYKFISSILSRKENVLARVYKKSKTSQADFGIKERYIEFLTDDLAQCIRVKYHLYTVVGNKTFLFLNNIFILMNLVHGIKISYIFIYILFYF